MVSRSQRRLGDEQHGFTLVEVTISLAIMAMAAAVVVPAVSNLTRADLRSSASKLGALMRQSYDEAALSGQTHRLVFDFETSVIGIEKTEEVLNFEPGSNVLAEASKAHEELDALMEVPDDLRQLFEAEAGDDEELDESPMSALGAMFAINDLSSVGAMTGESGAFGGGEGETNIAMKLDEGVKLLDVWVQGMGEPTAEGKSYLYFFPHGYTQDAIVHLEDREGTIFSVRVSALTGRTRIYGKYLEVPK